MEQETNIKIEEQKKLKESNQEPKNIHQVMYEISTRTWETQGGSENFQQNPS